MLVSSVVHCIAVLIFQLWGVQTLSLIPRPCPASCVCEKTLLVNCASLGLSKAPSHIPVTATALDLSHNALHSLAPLGSGHIHLQRLQHLWVGNNSLKSLSMCSGIQGIVGTKTLTRRKRRCVSWAPDLQLLSADRNQLKCLPRGLGNIKSLKVLQLSHNRISEIGPTDLAGCTHLNELHLQHNLINTIHPDAFKDLQKLKVLNVSVNLLATIPVTAYLSLRNLNVLVDISGNRWRCDCNLKTIRRWLSFDSELGNPAWEVVCVSPSHHAGKDLLYLEESELACSQPVYNTRGVKKELTVDEGMEFILYCSTVNQDFIHIRWWTPHGQISDSQPFLLISNTTVRDAGLYVCISGYQEEHVSVFDLHVREKAHDRRLRREAHIGSAELNEEDNDSIQRNVPAVRAVQQSQFELAVCLSVFITFIVAFVLGVILRPFLEKWYKQIQNKRSSTTSPSNSQNSSTGQRPYVNEGYSDTDDQEQVVHEGPRVTFGEVTEIQERAGVPYYVTVEDSPSGSNTDVEVLYENAEKKESLTENIELYKEVPLRRENVEMTNPGSTETLNAESSKGMQFEYIPDPADTELDERSISPASSLTSEQQEPQMSYESTEQSVDSPTVSIYEEDDEQASMVHHATIPGFTTDPFPLEMSESKEESVDELDPDLWNDSGESFSFTEGSPRSSSHVSPVAALGYPINEKEMSVDELFDRPSSCNSSESGESEGGPTEYTVNPEDDEDSESNDINSENRISPFEDDLTEDHKTDTGARFRQDTIILDPTDMHMTYTRGDSFDDEFTENKDCFCSSNISSEYEDEPTQYHVHPVYRTSRKTTSSCSEEDEDNHRRLEIKLEDKVHSTDATPVISPDRLLNINYDNSSSSTDIEDKCSKEKERGLSLKGLSGLSALLFNRSGSERNKKVVQLEPSTATTNSKVTGGFLGLSFKKQPSENVSPTTNDDNFFVTIGQAFNRLPKLKNSLLFSSSVPKPTHQQESTSIINKISESEMIHKSSSYDDSIFGKIDQTYPIPRVKRYLRFSQSSSCFPIQTPPCSAEEIIPNEVVKTESKKFTSEDDASATTKGDNFFGQIDATIADLPKVKRYVQFSPSESQLSNHSAHSASIKKVARPVVMPKTESPSDTINIFFEGQSISLPALTKVKRYVQFMQLEPQTVHKLTPTINGDSFLGQVPISFDEVPRVIQYVQFSPSESQLSNHSAHSASINQVARPVVMSKTESQSDTINIFFEGQSISLPALTKVKRYVQFMQLEPQTVHKLHSFFGQVLISFDEVPKVKRHILFSQLQSHQNPSKEKYPLIDERITPEIKPSQETNAQAKPHNSGDNFFGQIATSLNEVPKVKKYIQFTQSEVFSETSSSPLHEKVPTMQADTNLKSNRSPSKDCNPVVDELNFFVQIGMFFDGIPKVRRRIQFTEHSPQIPESQPPSSFKQPVTHAVTAKGTSSLSDAKLSQGKTNFFEVIHVSLDNIPKVNRSLQFTQFKVEPSNQSIPSFFGQIEISFDEVPKVKRCLQFLKYEPQPHSPSTSVITECVRPEFSTKMQSKGSEAVVSPSIKVDNFFVQIGASLHGLPKLKRYIQFSQSEHQSSAQSHSLPVITEIVTPMQSTRSEDKVNPTIKGEDFFGQTGSSFDGLPKVKRYIQFTQAEPRLKPPLLQSLTNKTEKTMKDLASEAYIHPAAGELNYFGPIGASSEITKVKRYIEFSQHSTQPSPKALHKQKATPVLTIPESGRSSSSPVESKSNNEDTFFKKMDASVSELPKVKRYIHFTQNSAPPKSSNTHRVTVDVAKKRETLGSDISKVEVKPPVTEEHFLGQLGTNLNSLPSVNRYIQFTQAEPYPSSQSQSPAEKMTKKEWKTLSSLIDSDAKSSTKYTFYDGISAPLDNIPKVKKALLFTPSKYQNSNQTEVPQKFTPHLVKKIKSVSSSSLSDKEVLSKIQDSFFGQLGIFLDEVPKVKRYIQFSQSKAYPPARSSIHILGDQSSPPVSKTEVVTPELATKAGFSSTDSSFEKKSRTDIKQDTFLGQTDAPFEEMPKVKGYIQFIKSEPQPSAQSLSTSVITEFVTPEFSTKMQSSRSEDKLRPTIKGDDFFDQTGSSFNGLPKVKRYIQFTQAEPRLQPPMLHSLSNKPEKTMKDLASEDYIQPGEHNYFGTTGASSEVPKVKGYIQFSQRSTQPSSLYLHRQKATKAELLTSHSSPVENRSNNEDTLFKKTDATVSELPKVKRYIQFTQQHSTPPKSSNSSIQRELWGSDLSMGYVKPNKTDEHFLGQLGTNLNSLPRVNRYIQFAQSEPYSSSQSQSPTEKMTKKEWQTLSSSIDNEVKSSTKDTFYDAVDASEYHNRTAANVKSINTADNVFGSFDLSFHQHPKVKRHVQIVKSEPYVSSPVQSKFLSHSNLENKQRFPYEDELKLTTKEKDSFDQIDGVPKLNRYTPFRQSEPHTQTLSPSISSQNWEMVDVGTESRMFKTNVTPVFTETSKLNQFPEPNRSLFSSKPDAHGQPDQVFNQVEEVYRQISSNSSSGDKKYANTQGSSRRTALSTTESETILESTLSSLGASSNESTLQTGKRQVMDLALQDISQSILEASSEKDNARAYLRDSSLARQRQERRRLLFQQKRRAMDGFNLTSESFTSQEGDQ